MPRISVPPDEDPLTFLWVQRSGPVGAGAGAFSDAVYKRSTLPIREFEAARTRIAQINDCALCLSWRTAREVAPADALEIPEEFYANVGVNPEWSGFSERERLAAEFAERFALDHQGMDDDLWARLHTEFSDEELVELGLCVGSWLALGRFNRVFDVDGACRVPAP